jgi:hypothetical protein
MSQLGFVYKEAIPNERGCIRIIYIGKTMDKVVINSGKFSKLEISVNLGHYNNYMFDFQYLPLII